MGLGIPGIGSVGKALDWAKDRASDAADTAGKVVQHTGQAAGAAAQQVVQGGASVVNGAGRAVRSAAATAGQGLGTAWHAAEHAAGRVVHGAGQAAQRVTSTGSRVVDLALQGGSQAVNRGAQVADRVLDTARAVATPGGFERKLKDLTAPADTLRPGDSVTFHAGVNVNAAVSAGGHGEVTIQRAPDGSYTVSGEVDGTLGGKVTDTGLTFGAGARMEFRADTPEQARDMAVTLLKAGTQAGVTSTNPALGPLGALYGPSHDELSQLKDNLSAVELQGSAAAGAGATLGLTPDLGGGAEVGAQGEQVLRVEFEGGRPSAAVMRTTLQADGAAGNGVATLVPPGAVRPAADALGVDPRSLLAGGQVQASITVEQRVALRPTEASTGHVLASLPGAAFGPLRPLGPGGGLPGVVPDGPPQTSVTLQADAVAEGSDRGIHGELRLSGVGPGQAAGVVNALARGDVQGAAQAAGGEVAYEYHGFREDAQGLDLGFVVGDVQATRTVTHTDTSHSGGVQFGPDGLRSWQSHDSVARVRAGSSAAASLPHQPAFGPTPADTRRSATAFEIQVGEELARGIGLANGPDDPALTALVKELHNHHSRLPAAASIPEPELLHAPRINAGGSGGNGEPFVRPDWVVVQDPARNPQVLAVEATLDSNFALNTGGGAASHKQLQVPGTIDALVNTFGPDRPIAYVIRSPREPGPQAQQSLDDLQRLLNSDPKYRNVTVTWVAG